MFRRGKASKAKAMILCLEAFLELPVVERPLEIDFKVWPSTKEVIGLS
jgi:hypothetical protein